MFGCGTYTCIKFHDNPRWWSVNFTFRCVAFPWNGYYNVESEVKNANQGVKQTAAIYMGSGFTKTWISDKL
jgi:hypothetical protein